jgi:hypothetical protein
MSINSVTTRPAAPATDARPTPSVKSPEKAAAPSKPVVAGDTISHASRTGECNGVQHHGNAGATSSPHLLDQLAKSVLNSSSAASTGKLLSSPETNKAVSSFLISGPVGADVGGLGPTPKPHK